MGSNYIWHHFGVLTPWFICFYIPSSSSLSAKSCQYQWHFWTYSISNYSFLFSSIAVSSILHISYSSVLPSACDYDYDYCIFINKRDAHFTQSHPVWSSYRMLQPLILYTQKIGVPSSTIEQNKYHRGCACMLSRPFPLVSLVSVSLTQLLSSILRTQTTWLPVEPALRAGLCDPHISRVHTESFCSYLSEQTLTQRKKGPTHRKDIIFQSFQQDACFFFSL